MMSSIQAGLNDGPTLPSPHCSNRVPSRREMALLVGTGGASIFALQLAKKASARVYVRAHIAAQDALLLYRPNLETQPPRCKPDRVNPGPTDLIVAYHSIAPSQ